MTVKNKIVFNALSGSFDQTIDTDGLNSELALKAPLVSPALTGNPTAPTQLTADDSTRIATTEFVNNAIAAAGAGGGSYITITTDTFNGDGTETSFTLSVDPLSIDNTQIHINGVYQNKATYSVTGTALEFTEAPPTGIGNIEVEILNLSAVGSLPDATSSVKGVIKLAGDIEGSADLPTIKSATTLSKGLIKLSGDLSNTADSPIVKKYIDIINCPIILGSSGLSSLLGATYFRCPQFFTITAVEIQLFTKNGASSGNLELDVLKAPNLQGSPVDYASIMTTKPIINMATAADYDAAIGVINSSLAEINGGQFIRVDLTQIPAGLQSLHVRVYGI